jgi:hypothetical protein
MFKPVKGPPGGRFDKKRSAKQPPKPTSDRSARLRELVQRGIPEKFARQIVNGQKELNAVLLAMAQEDRIRQLQERHGLGRALACQVVTGVVDLDKVLLRIHLEAYRKTHPDRSVFDDALRSGEVLSFGCHGRITRNLRVLENHLYEVHVEEPTTGVRETLHKTRVKYAHRPDDGRLIRRVMAWDKELRKLDVEPRLKPQDRFDCSDRWLFQQMDLKNRVLVTLVEGEQFSGTLSWLGRFEIGLVLKGGLELYVLRHALASAQAE